MFDEWMEQLALLLHQYARLDLTYSPFTEDEVPGVSVLLAAASRANYLPIAEYWTEKLSRSDLKTKVVGRGDLWLARGTTRYSFEFKRAHTGASLEQLDQAMQLANDDLECVTDEYCDYAFASVIAPVESGSTAAHESFAAFDFGFAIGGRERPDVFLYFKSW